MENGSFPAEMKKCDECGVNPANVHLTQIINNETTMMSLCDKCARKKGITISIDENAMMQSAAGEDEEYKGLKCPGCGLEYLEFKAKGWLGCAECYSAFGKEIDQLLIGVHGSSEHKGKRYGGYAAPGRDQAGIRRLRQRLQTAIRNEEFELAAEIRDTINQRAGQRQQ
jgi:protein arginine kinase activator